MTFEEWWKGYTGSDKDKSLVMGKVYAQSAWDYQQARNEALESLLQAEQDSNHRLSAKELELAARNDALEAERDSLKDSLRRVLRKLPHVDRKILAERHGIKETDHE